MNALEADFGFSKKKRLLNKADYKAVFDCARVQKSAFFTMLARPNAQPLARLGVIVAKRLLKRAVDRHRIQRMIRESFRHNQALLVGLDVIVLLRSDCRNQTAQGLRDCLEKQWQDLQRRCKAAS